MNNNDHINKDEYDFLIAELTSISDTAKIDNEHEVRQTFKREFYQKGQRFVNQGDFPEKLGFITNGLMKYYYVDLDGNEWVKHFSAEGDFVTSYGSFIYNIPSLYFIETIEDTTMLTISKEQYLANIDESMTWCIVARKYTEKIYFDKEKREASFLQMNGTERYLNFLHEYKQLSNRIAVKDVASFLGLTSVSLSRIRSKIIQPS